MRPTPPSRRPMPPWILLIVLLSSALPASGGDPAAHAVSFEAAPAVPDFGSIMDSRLRKERFFAFLLPYVQAENEELRTARRRLEYIHDHVRFRRPVRSEDREWLSEIAQEYGLEEIALQDAGFWDRMCLRLDEIPSALVLVQAALESAWGTSRFARVGNNFFGLWCFRPGCGMVPAGRPSGAEYEVASYATVRESVRSYLLNLNCGRPYARLRGIRDELRRSGRKLDAATLADGLHGYSQRGEAYVDELRAMLRQNGDLIRALLEAEAPTIASG